jgi:hypothetical protein
MNKFKFFNKKGQTFVEFILIFVVLFIATSGIFAMYKKIWKKRYDKTAVVSGAGAAVVKQVNSDITYVK